ncbi:Uncharacterized protein dnm_006200 [Desulfonema magnum]|uniref:Uncharacterized protein n=1 Tax=Desulfonema magnum TaxID=45655 RepID=A0A975BFW8_9BACT|nr:Uncharacterized protein dnm_006200 [Desulfonema magnum]
MNFQLFSIYRYFFMTVFFCRQICRWFRPLCYQAESEEIPAKRSSLPGTADSCFHSNDRKKIIESSPAF